MERYRYESGIETRKRSDSLSERLEDALDRAQAYEKEETGTLEEPVEKSIESQRIHQRIQKALEILDENEVGQEREHKEEPAALSFQKKTFQIEDDNEFGKKGDKSQEGEHERFDLDFEKRSDFQNRFEKALDELEKDEQRWKDAEKKDELILRNERRWAELCPPNDVTKREKVDEYFFSSNLERHL